MSNIKPYLLATIITLSIWIVAILINTIVVIYWVDSPLNNGFDTDVAGLIICFSAMFSSPGLVIVGIAFMLRLKNKGLFNTLLAATFFATLMSLLLFALFLQSQIKGISLIVFFSPVPIALLSVLAHKPFINLVTYKYTDEPCIETL